MNNKGFMKIVLIIIIILTGGLNLMASVPAAWEDPADNITTTGARFRAYVNPGGESTTVIIDWGTTIAYGNTVTVDQSPVIGRLDTLVTYTITGLSASTQYFYRVTAINGSGSSSGEGTSFYTLADIVVTTNAASAVTTTTATLNGNIFTINVDTDVTFEYGTTISYGSSVNGSPSPVTGTVSQPVSAPITGLTPGIEYHFRCVGTTADGTTYGQDMTFTTSAPGAPTVTTEKVHYTFIANRVILKAIANANNSDTIVTFEYGTSSGVYGAPVTGTPNPVSGVVDTEVSYILSGLTADTMYYYRAVATNAQDTVNGSEQSFYNTVAPDAETLPATTISKTAAQLNGIIAPKEYPGAPGDSPSTTTVVTFEYGETLAYGSTITAVQSPVGAEAYVNVNALISSLTPNTLYHYRVIATNANGTGTGADMTFTTSSLPIVTTDTASPVGTNSATLNGTVNANDDSTTVTFEYGATAAYGFTLTAVQSPVTGSTDTAVSRGITGLINGQIYHYRVIGTNSSGTSYGEDFTFITGVSPPSVSTNGANVVDDIVTMNGVVNANGYPTSVNFEWGETVSYGRSNNAVPNIVTGSTNTDVSLQMTGFTPGTLYHYRVVGVNAGGTVYGADMTFIINAGPTAVTNTASAVNTTSATLNGTINAAGLSTTITFEYGTTIGYGTTVTADQSPVTGTSDTPVSRAITGLTPSITYHYRVVALGGGIVYGADMTFITTVGAPAVTTDAATSVVFSSAVLNGTVNANNASTTATFEYGTTVAYGSTITADQSPVAGSTDTAVTASLTGLTFGATYHYRAVGSSASGTTNGADMTFTPTTNPSVSTDPASNVLATTATMNGTVTASISAVNTSFEYGTTVAYGFTVTGTPEQVNTVDGPTPVNAGLIGLIPNTTYHYRVRAVPLFGGGTFFGGDLTFTTPAGPTVTTNAASSVGSATAIINGTVNANNESTTVTFEYGLDANYGQTVPADQSPVTGSIDTNVSFTITSLIPNTTVHFRVVATNASGTVSGVDDTFTTLGSSPLAVTDPASGISAAGATLNGTVNAQNDSAVVTFEYGLTTGYGTIVTAVQSPLTGNANNPVSFPLTGLTSNTTYHYRVTAQNGTGTTNGADRTFFTGISAPVAITNAATGIGIDYATLNGLVNANNGTTTVTFEIGTTLSYGSSVTAVQSPLTGSNNTAVSFSHTGLTGNTTYHYRVVAVNGSGTTNGADMTFTTNAAGSPTAVTGNATSVTSRIATFNGTVNPNSDSTTVSFQYGTTINYGSTMTADQSPLTGGADIAVSKNITNLFPNTTYHYRVVAQNVNGTVYGDDMTFTTVVARPFVRTDSATSLNISGATLNALVNANNSDATVIFEYGTDISYGKSINGVPAMVTGSEDNNINAVLTGLMSKTTYHYRVVAQNAEGRSLGGDRTFFTGNSDPAEIDLNREKINFGALYGDLSKQTPAQTLLINNIGGSTLQWSVMSSDPWILISEMSGSGSGIVSVSANPAGLPIGKYTGSITVSDPDAVNASVSVEIVLNVLESSVSPFGEFTTPLDGSTLRGSVPVTGWILDDIVVENIKIYREQMGLLIYIGDAVMVEGARPDIELMYPDYPENYKAGWGYMLLTNALPDNGNGTFTLYAKAMDIEGNVISLGTKTIVCDNANAVKPFGAIDAPAQGGITSGESFMNLGWALTPQPNYIPEDGSTINVYLDGVNIGHPAYNIYREDIAALFPGYQNSEGAGGSFTLDTTAYTNGVHTIQWTATDSGGNTDGIGSRYFSIINIGSKLNIPNSISFGNIDSLPENTDQFTNVRGEGIVGKFTAYADDNGINTFKSRELLPIEIRSINGGMIVGGFSYHNYKTGRLLPGSTLDSEKGIFYWTPPVGFYGKYGFLFIIKTPGGQLERKYFNIEILSKFSMEH